MSGKNYTEFTDTPVAAGHIRIYSDHTGRFTVDIPEFLDEESPEAQHMNSVFEAIRDEILAEDITVLRRVTESTMRENI
jgi:hypothetical protein